jgi:formylglycine-generating enzyme required for sulfatase activity
MSLARELLHKWHWFVVWVSFCSRLYGEAPGDFENEIPSPGTSYSKDQWPAQLVWKASARAVSYDVYLQRETSVPAIRVASGLPFNRWTVDRSLEPGIWYWRIVAQNPDGTKEGAIWFFVIHDRAVLPPEAFDNESPENGFSFPVGLPPSLLNWESSENAESYDLFLALDGHELSSPILQGLTESQWIVDSRLGPGTWNWKVRARNNGGISESDTWQFTVKGDKPQEVSLSIERLGESLFVSYDVLIADLDVSIYGATNLKELQERPSLISESVSGTDGTGRVLITQERLAGASFFYLQSSNKPEMEKEPPPIMYAPPVILSEPLSVEITNGGEAVFEVSAIADRPLSYQWLHNGTDLNNGPTVSGANSATLRITSVSGRHQGDYQVKVSSVDGENWSQVATLSLLSEINLILSDWIPKEDSGATLYGSNGVNAEIEYQSTGRIMFRVPDMGYANTMIHDSFGLNFVNESNDVLIDRVQYEPPFLVVPELLNGFTFRNKSSWTGSWKGDQYSGQSEVLTIIEDMSARTSVSAGIFETLQLSVTSSWSDSLGDSGVDRWRFWLTPSIGIVKVEVETPDFQGVFELSEIPMQMIDTAPPKQKPENQVPRGFSLVQGGVFTMGSPAHEIGHDNTETQHSVSITRDIYVKETEVTFSKWKEVRDWGIQNGYFDLPQKGRFVLRPRPNNESEELYPITGITWYDAIKWLNAWSEMDNRTACYMVAGSVYRDGEEANVECNWEATGYRLPTEAEWEYSCRAGSSSAFSSGEITKPSPPFEFPCLPEPAMDLAGWYCDNSEENTHQVGLKEPNAWGLFDMHGNAEEWCWDWADNYRVDIVEENPAGPANGGWGNWRVIRGGDFRKVAMSCRSASRRHDSPLSPPPFVGFRAVFNAEVSNSSVTIVDQPSDQVFKEGQRVVLSVSVEGAGPIGFQWSRNGVDVLDDARISGAMTAELIISNAGPADTGIYRLSVSNETGIRLSDRIELSFDVAAGNDSELPGFVEIPAGSFIMGSPRGEFGRSFDEVDHEVTITNGFFLYQKEMTFDHWRVVRDWGRKNGYSDLPDGKVASSSDGHVGQHPVSDVSWSDVVKWLNAWSELEGHEPCYYFSGEVYRAGSAWSISCDWSANGYRLPSEAEWEYACRAGTTTAYYTGQVTTDSDRFCMREMALEDSAWYCSNSESNSHEGGRKLRNGWGLYDMLGNSAEWCWDSYAQYQFFPKENPVGPERGGERIVRGGHTGSLHIHCRAANRDKRREFFRSDSIGFRPAVSR